MGLHGAVLLLTLNSLGQKSTNKSGADYGDLSGFLSHFSYHDYRLEIMSSHLHNHHHRPNNVGYVWRKVPSPCQIVCTCGVYTIYRHISRHNDGTFVMILSL